MKGLFLRKNHNISFSIKNIFSQLLYFHGNTFLEVKIFEVRGIFSISDQTRRTFNSRLKNWQFNPLSLLSSDRAKAVTLLRDISLLIRSRNK